MQQEKSLTVLEATNQTTNLESVERDERSMFIRPRISASDLREYHETEVVGFANKALRKGIDFDSIPGTQNRLVLLKPGAELLAMAFGFAQTFSIVEQEVEHDRDVSWTKEKKIYGTQRREQTTGNSLGLYRYVVRCDLVSKKTGEVMGSGMGSASSMEGKYVDRPRDVENTVLKMAKKRALVDAVLGTLALSGRFTQDMEDLEENERGRRREVERHAAPQPTPQPTRQPTQSATAELKNGLGRLWRLAQSVGMDEERFKYLRREIGLTQDPLSHTAQAMAELEGRILDWAKAPGDDEPVLDAKPDAVFDRLTRG